MIKQIRQTACTYVVNIYIAGDISDARRACKEFCELGLCVNITEVDFIYTKGSEYGVKIELINYPRFPKSSSDIWDMAVNLAIKLKHSLFQKSVLVMDDRNTLWISEEDV